MRTMLSTLAFASLAASTACDSSPLPPAQSSSQALTCFHTDSSVTCVSTDEDDPEMRVKIEDFYPSVCLDGDEDADGVPDYLDLDYLRAHPDAESDQELGCPRCNRGPGTQNDFRLEFEGDIVELDRGKVYAIDADGSLAVPTDDGMLFVVVTDDTRIDDGPYAPGAEVRVEGTLDEHGDVIAERLKVLCPAPGDEDSDDGNDVPEDDVPEDGEPLGDLVVE